MNCEEKKAFCKGKKFEINKESSIGRNFQSFGNHRLVVTIKDKIRMINLKLPIFIPYTSRAHSCKFIKVMDYYSQNPSFLIRYDVGIVTFISDLIMPCRFAREDLAVF